MSRIDRRHEPQLSESWASMIVDEDDNAGSFDSEEEHSHQAQPTASRNERFRDTLQDNDHNSPPTDHVAETNSHDIRTPLQGSTTQRRIRVTEYLDTPRARNGRQRPPEPELRMPSVNASIDFDDHPTLRSRTHAQPPRRPLQQSEIRERSLRTIRSPRKSPAQQRVRSPQTQTDYLQVVWFSVLMPVLQYALSVLTIVLTALKPLIGYGLLVWWVLSSVRTIQLLSS